MTILTISLIFLPTVLSDSLTSVQTTSSSKPFAYAYGQEELSSEEAYLHLVSDIVQQQSNNNSNTTTTTTIQIPETAKGQAIILKKDI